MRFTRLQQTGRLQQAGLAAAVLAGAGLLTALVAENWGGVVPCALCLLERWPYRATIVLGVLTAVLHRGAGLLLGLAVLVMLGSAVLGGLHVGVEAGLWPSPLPECAAPSLGGGTMAERLARMPAKPAKPCDEPTYLVPGLPLSMAGMNLMFSLALAGGLTMVVWPRRSVA